MPELPRNLPHLYFARKREGGTVYNQVAGAQSPAAPASYKAVILGIISPRIAIIPAAQDARLLEENLFQPRKHPLRGGSLWQDR
jgi:hypothetical protein